MCGGAAAADAIGEVMPDGRGTLGLAAALFSKMAAAMATPGRFDATTVPLVGDRGPDAAAAAAAAATLNVGLVGFGGGVRVGIAGLGGGLRFAGGTGRGCERFGLLGSEPNPPPSAPVERGTDDI